MKEICTVSIGTGILDNDYTFYDDGRIKRFYDRNMQRYNIEAWVSVGDISTSDKSKILQKCSDEDREYLTSVLIG